MRHHRWLAILAAVWFVSAAPAQDVKQTLSIIPEDAVAFAVTNRLDQGNEKIHMLLKQLNVPIPASPLDIAKGLLGITKGLNDKGCAAVVLFTAKEQKEPVAIFLIPVSDYKEFLAQFKAKDDGISEITLDVGKKLLVAKKGQHAVLADVKQRKTLERVLGSEKGLAGWAQPIQNWLDGNDLTLVATPHGVKSSVDTMRKALFQARNNLGQADNPIMGRYLDAIDGCLQSIVSDVTHMAIGSKLDKAGNLHVEARALFASGSGFAKASAGVKPLAGGPLAGLPQGPFALAFGGAIPDGAMEEILKINVELMKLASTAGGKEIPKDKLKKMEEHLASTMRGLRGMSMVMGGGKEDTLFSGVVGTFKVDDAQAYIANYEKMVPEMNAIYKGLNIPGFDQTMEVKKLKIDKLNVLEVVTKFGAAGNDPLQKKIMEAMFGPDGKMTVSLAAIDANTVFYIYKPAMQAAFGKKMGSLQDDAKVAATLALLPQGSQWVFLIDPKGTLEMTARMVKTFAPDAGVQIPSFPPTAPIGMGARLSENGLTLETVIPAQFFDGLGKLLQPKGN